MSPYIQAHAQTVPRFLFRKASADSTDDHAVQKKCKLARFPLLNGLNGATVEALCRSVEDMERGLIDANLGGGIIKKRVALPGRGKRGSARTLVATNSANRWFFVFGFEKNDRDNINAKELRALKALASDLLRLGVSELSAAVAAKTLQEICHEN